MAGQNDSSFFVEYGKNVPIPPPNFIRTRRDTRKRSILGFSTYTSPKVGRVGGLAKLHLQAKLLELFGGVKKKRPNFPFPLPQFHRNTLRHPET